MGKRKAFYFITLTPACLPVTENVRQLSRAKNRYRTYLIVRKINFCDTDLQCSQNKVDIDPPPGAI